MTNILMSRSGALISDFAIPTLKTIIKPNMKVVILGFSFFGNLNEADYFDEYGKDSEYANKMSFLFEQYDISDVNWLYYYNSDISDAEKLLKEADILYIPGGAPDLMMKRIIDKGLLEIIKSFDKIIIGSSAGSMIQLAKFHISPDNEYNKFSLHKGLGYIDEFFIEVHYRRRRKQKSSMRKMRKTYLKPIYSIPDDGIIVKQGNKITTLGTAKKIYTKHGINK